jgi:hypothetical protein
VRIAFFQSNFGGSPLVDGLRRGCQSWGHYVEQYQPGQGYDLAFVFNQCAHTSSYIYPDFPAANIPIVFIDSAEYGYFKRLPEIVGNYANAFSSGSMSHPTKNLMEQTRLRQFLEGRSFPYFLREHSIYLEFPPEYHPIDYPLYYTSAWTAPEREEYLSRPLDLFVSWGGSHPWRLGITSELRKAVVRSEISLVDIEAPRMPQTLYFDKTRSAKCSVSFDGYGSGSFRMTEVLVRTLLLQGPLTIRRHADLMDGVHCVKYNIINDGETFIGSDVCQKMQSALDDPEQSFRILEAGYHHCMSIYNEQATAQYVLDMVSKHDWNKPTQITL